MKLGIIGAMDMEIDILHEAMEDKRETKQSGMTFYEGTLNGLPAVIVQCGVGKVNAAICTQLLCSSFGVTHLVNTGVAGSLDPKLDICDTVVSTAAVHHDVNATMFGYPICRVPGMDTTAFPADAALIEAALCAADAVNPGHAHKGLVASGDQFIVDPESKQTIIRNTGAACVEMEGAAIAQTAYRNGVPFVILRAISDKADGSDFMDYAAFERISAERCAAVTERMAAMLRKA